MMESSQKEIENLEVELALAQVNNDLQHLAGALGTVVFSPSARKPLFFVPG